MLEPQGLTGAPVLGTGERLSRPMPTASASVQEIVARILALHRNRIAVVELDAHQPVTTKVDIALLDTFAQPEADGNELKVLIANPLAAKIDWPDAPKAADGHWIVIDGRRWRVTDPAIPSALRSELVAALMDARRAVARHLRVRDQAGVAAARQRVGDAKVALGERGAPWWEVPTELNRHGRLTAAMRTLAHRRAPKTTCPSDAARVAGGPSWRSYMLEARAVATELAVRGEIDVIQRNEIIDPLSRWHGPVRLRWREAAVD
jgi:hypothetical protein